MQLPAPGSGAAGRSDSMSYTTSLPSTSSSFDNMGSRESLHSIPDTQDMRHEEKRVKTFDSWPVSFLSPDRLAKNGFYYLGRGDEVRCAFCKVEIMQWVEGDDPEMDHQRWSPQCSLVRKLNAGKMPPELLEIKPAAADRIDCDSSTAAAKPAPMPVHPRYAPQAARLRSFKGWPHSLRKLPEDLAEAGFFYTGQGDKTKCFFCDGGLKDWEEDDVPWEQHARWFDRCAYVQLVKGREYVQKVISQACVIPALKEQMDTTPTTAPQEPQTTIAPEKDDKPQMECSKLCKICYEEERNVCFVPCGHVVACAKCALSTVKCPMCRTTFTSAVRLYFS